MALPNPTTGTGVSANVAIDSSNVSLSLAGVATHQIVATVKDAAGTIQTGVALTLSAVANASGGTSAYTGTITNGGSNAFAGYTFIVAGFVTGANNGTFECTASTTTVLTLANTAGVAETHAGTATSESPGAPVKYVSRNAAVATVSASGLITGIAKGGTTVEASFPVFGNGLGLANDGTYAEKVYAEINVTVGV